jgi:hypothetical protein
VSSLWTPGGEYPVGERRTSTTPPDAGAAPSAESFEDEDLDEASVRAQIDEARARLAEVPANVIVLNHAMGLYELAAIHLSSAPPDLGQAALAIDAFACLVEGLGERLGPDSATLRDALAQIRLGFVQIKGSADGGAPPSS